MGRILSRLSKDQDTLDTQLALIMYQVRRVLLFFTIPVFVFDLDMF